MQLRVSFIRGDELVIDTSKVELMELRMDMFEKVTSIVWKDRGVVEIICSHCTLKSALFCYTPFIFTLFLFALRIRCSA